MLAGSIAPFSNSNDHSAINCYGMIVSAVMLNRTTPSTERLWRLEGMPSDFP